MRINSGINPPLCSIWDCSTLGSPVMASVLLASLLVSVGCWLGCSVMASFVRFWGMGSVGSRSLGSLISVAVCTIRSS